jgi:hypothetical protein
MEGKGPTASLPWGLTGDIEMPLIREVGGYRGTSVGEPPTQSRNICLEIQRHKIFPIGALLIGFPAVARKIADRIAPLQPQQTSKQRDKRADVRAIITSYPVYITGSRSFVGQEAESFQSASS